LVIYLGLVLVASWIALTVVTWLVRFRPDQDVHWTERARQLLPVRGILMFCGWILIAEYAVFSFAVVGVLSPVSRELYGLVVLLSAFLVVSFCWWRFERRWRGDWLTLGSALKGRLTFLLVFLPWLPVVVMMAVLVPASVGPRLWTTISVGVPLMLAMTMGGGFYLARLVGLVKPAPERLRLLVEQAAASGGVQLRGTYVLATPMVNAVALPFLRVVGFTERAVEILDDAEVLAIAHHEIGHLAEPDAVKLGRLRALFLFVVLACWRPIFHYFGWWGLLFGVLVGFLINKRVVVVSRRGEAAADEHAHTHAEADAHSDGDYARALEHIHAANLLPAVMRGKRHIHPHLYDRMLAAGVTPDFERPEPPPRRTRLALVSLAVVVVVVVGSIVPPTMVANRADRSERSAWLALLVTGGNSQTFAGLAEHRLKDRAEEAAVLLEAAVEIAPWRPSHGARLADVLISLGRLDEAEAVLQQAEATHRQQQPTESYTDKLLRSARIRLQERRRKNGR